MFLDHLEHVGLLTVVASTNSLFPLFDYSVDTFLLNSVESIFIPRPTAATELSSQSLVRINSKVTDSSDFPELKHVATSYFVLIFKSLLLKMASHPLPQKLLFIAILHLGTMLSTRNY